MSCLKRFQILIINGKRYIDHSFGTPLCTTADVARDILGISSHNHSLFISKQISLTSLCLTTTILNHHHSLFLSRRPPPPPSPATTITTITYLSHFSLSHHHNLFLSYFLFHIIFSLHVAFHGFSFSPTLRLLPPPHLCRSPSSSPPSLMSDLTSHLAISLVGGTNHWFSPTTVVFCILASVQIGLHEQLTMIVRFGIDRLLWILEERNKKPLLLCFLQTRFGSTLIFLAT